MTDKTKPYAAALSANFKAGAAHRSAQGQGKLQLTMPGAIAAMLAAMDTLGFEAENKNFSSCIARISLKDATTGAVKAAIQVNRNASIWKEGNYPMLLETVVGNVTDVHRQAAEKVIEELGL